MDTSATTPNDPGIPLGSEPPKKYIRTFHGDMEMLKKGGTPDLKPLVPKATKPVPEPIPVKKPLPPQPPPVPPPPPPPSPPPPQPEPKPTPIETYADDFSQRLKSTKASTATVLAVEQDAKAGVVFEPKEKHGGALSVIAGLILLGLGGAGAYFAYTNYVATLEPVLLAPVAETPIFVDEREAVTGESPAEVLHALQQSLARPLAQNSVRLLYAEFSTTGSTTSPQATGTSVFSALQLPAPSVLLRNVNAAGSIAGIINADGGQTPFFILSVASYGDTFAGMLSWEANMPGDLAALFPSYAEGFGGQAPVATTATTAPISVPLFSVLFHDEVVSNHDVRIYRDVEGRSVILYGYWNQTTMVIARDPAAFSELLARLATSRSQ